MNNINWSVKGIQSEQVFRDITVKFRIPPIVREVREIVES